MSIFKNSFARVKMEPLAKHKEKASFCEYITKQAYPYLEFEAEK